MRQRRHRRSGQGRARRALQDAASVAGLLITTEAMVAEEAEEGAAPADAGRRRHGRHGRHGLLKGPSKS